MSKIEKEWQASEARANLPEVLKRALAGKPQAIRHRSGEEVVVISRSQFDAMRPTLREYLLASAGAVGDDGVAALENAGRDARATRAGFTPRQEDDE